jgi:transposase InsO family protein
LILYDSFSKWLETHLMGMTDGINTIDILTTIFSTFGYPEKIVSDNGPPVTGEKFNQFCVENNIVYSFSPPYHSQSNGSAARAVKIVKKALKKQLLESKYNNFNFNTKTALQSFLLTYRNTPSLNSHKTPAELEFKKLPKTKLADLNPLFSHEKHEIPIITPKKSFQDGENIIV